MATEPAAGANPVPPNLIAWQILAKMGKHQINRKPSWQHSYSLMRGSAFVYKDHIVVDSVRVMQPFSHQLATV